jgi:hypothetical protein
MSYKECREFFLESMMLPSGERVREAVMAFMKDMSE